MQQTFVSSAAMPQIPPTFANEGKNEPAVYHQVSDMLSNPDAGALLSLENEPYSFESTHIQLSRDTCR